VIRPERDRNLARARTKCETDRTKTTEACKRRRARVRIKARAGVKQEKATRKTARDRARLDMGKAPTVAKVRKYSRAESDSLASGSIPDDLLFLWKTERRRYSYADTPDTRALAFLEWVDLNPGDVDQARAAHIDETYTDAFYAKQERQAFAEAVPF
jgi:hypothetical protein